MITSKRRVRIFIAIVAIAALLFTFFSAPGNNLISTGSTYSRSPDGYGAWYAFMESRGTPVKRWQRPFDAFKNKEPVSFLRVLGNFELANLDAETRDWLAEGNTLITLGQWQPVTPAPFSSTLTSPSGETVKIETRRRAPDKKVEKPLLRDRFGTVAWEEAVGEGRAVWVTTPYLAANTYQNEADNYEFLARLLAEPGQTIWVDEYLHGYRDPDPEDKEEKVVSVFDYLARTPLLPILIQSAVVFSLAVLAQNRRFGRPQPLKPPEENNSQAYIQALASVLQRARSSEFVTKTIGEAEQLALQKRLGLGSTLLEPDVVLKAWQVQTGRDLAELKSLLQQSSRPRVLRDRELLLWLEKWQTARRWGSDRGN